MIDKIMNFLYGEESTSEIKGAVDADMYHACNPSQPGVQKPEAYIKGYGKQMDENIKKNGGKASWFNRHES